MLHRIIRGEGPHESLARIAQTLKNHREQIDSLQAALHVTRANWERQRSQIDAICALLETPPRRRRPQLTLVH